MPASKRAASASPIRVGIGGWTYEPWRGEFFPQGLAQRRELEYASRQVTAIEINGTYYGTQKRASFAAWRDETPDDFVFSMKASRYATNRRELAGAGDSIQRFVDSGIAELGPKLGPIVWQFAPTKRFDAADFEAFLRLLPDQVEGLPLQHVLDVRHDSFCCAEYVALARRYQASTVLADSDEYPTIVDRTGPLVYARLMKAQSRYRSGYPPKAITAWAQAALNWADGKFAADVSSGASAGTTPLAPPLRGRPKQVFVYVINGAKERAPAAARALLKQLGRLPEALAD